LADEEGAMPDWLAAITTSATGQYEDLRFEEADTYSSSAEASGIVSENDLDWLAPLGEEAEDEPTKDEAEERADSQPLDMDAIFAGVESLGVEGDKSAADEAEFSDLELGDLELAANDIESDAETMQSWFADIPARSEDEGETDEAAQDELFDFEFPKTQVAQPDDLAHTRDVGEDDEGDMPWLEDDASVPDDFSFEELAPRWLRHPKEGSLRTSLHEHDAAPEAPDWLRDVFEDDELDE
jgi:hypothetical protein